MESKIDAYIDIDADDFLIEDGILYRCCPNDSNCRCTYCAFYKNNDLCRKYKCFADTRKDQLDVYFRKCTENEFHGKYQKVNNRLLKRIRVDDYTTCKHCYFYERLPNCSAVDCIGTGSLRLNCTNCLYKEHNP